MSNEQKQECGEFRVNGWHLKKEVTITQIITLLALLISGLVWSTSVESRFIQLAGELQRIEQKQDIQNKNIEKILGRIERKQDKLFDKMEAKANK